MFKGLIRRLQGSVDDIFKNMVLRALVALPFAIAAIFGIAALSTRLSTLYGPVTAYGVLAASFFFIGLIAVTIFGTAPSKLSEPASEAIESETSKHSGDSEMPVDIETVIAAVAAVGPSVVPVVGRAAIRNWALVLLAAAVVFLVDSDKSEKSAPPIAAE